MAYLYLKRRRLPTVLETRSQRVIGRVILWGDLQKGHWWHGLNKDSVSHIITLSYFYLLGILSYMTYLVINWIQGEVRPNLDGKMFIIMMMIMIMMSHPLCHWLRQCMMHSVRGHLGWIGEWGQVAWMECWAPIFLKLVRDKKKVYGLSGSIE